MSKFKNIQKAAEQAGLLAKAPTAPTSRGLPPLAGIDDLSKFKTPDDVANAVENQKLLDEEAARKRALADPSGTPDWDLQATNPEDFQARVGQLTNPKFADEANLKQTQAGIPQSHLDQSQEGISTEAKYKLWEEDQVAVLEVVRNNPQLMSWGREGAYTRGSVFGKKVANPDDPVIWFRMDMRRDPRSDLTPIQFDPSANQFGMHIGTKKAGQGIITPKGQAASKRKMDKIRTMFDDLSNKEPKARELFQEAWTEARTNLFLRQGEAAFETPNMEMFNSMVDEFFEELQSLASQRGARGLEKINNVEDFKRQLGMAMRLDIDPVQHPLMTNAKQGLFVRDLGPSNTAEGIAENLMGRDIFTNAELNTVLNAGGNTEQNIALRKLLREKGYDHLVYVNNGEDAGAISIVLFDEDNYQNLLKPTIGPQPTGHQVGTNSGMDTMKRAITETEGQRIGRLEMQKASTPDVRPYDSLESGVNDVYIRNTAHGVVREKKRIELIKNPTKRDLAKVNKTYMRVMKDKAGNVYIWPADEALHADMIDHLKMRKEVQFAGADGEWLDSDGMLGSELLAQLNRFGDL